MVTGERGKDTKKRRGGVEREAAINQSTAAITFAHGARQKAKSV